LVQFDSRQTALELLLLPVQHDFSKNIDFLLMSVVLILPPNLGLTSDKTQYAKPA